MVNFPFLFLNSDEAAGHQPLGGMSPTAGRPTAKAAAMSGSGEPATFVNGRHDVHTRTNLRQRAASEVSAHRARISEGKRCADHGLRALAIEGNDVSRDVWIALWRRGIELADDFSRVRCDRQQETAMDRTGHDAG